MSHFSDFMEGVPVKISEKYKKPPAIELPYSVIECPLRAQNFVDNVKYCSNFESNVLIKVKELRRLKETKKNERRHRIQLLQEEKQKKLDAIAVAEEQDRLKQLSVSEVSYPSTDEINPSTPDEKTELNCDNIQEKETAEVNITDINIIPTTTTNESQNILQPTLVKSNYEGSLLDEPNPLERYKLNAKVSKIQYNHNIDTLTFRDFENDTSSPFDNVELKTINDMELLAQVLQSQKENITCQQQPYQTETGYTVPNCASQAQIGMPCLPNAYVEQPIYGQGMMYHNYTNNYYAPEPENIPQNYQYNIPNPYTSNYYNEQVPSTEPVVVPNGAQYSNPYFYQYSPVQYQPNYLSNEQLSHGSNEVQEQTQTPIKMQNIDTEERSMHTLKSRSRSVPDIVKELNDELAKLKMSERSYNVSPAPVNIPQPSSSKPKKSERRRKKSEHLPNPYDRLPSKLQDMCQRIHGMGFPLDRVARVCTLVGDNDKKVIECLLVVGEMIDLGFSEASVSTALAKHDFNRDKAIDELVQ